MKIICDSCGAKYAVSDEKVQGKTVKVKCRKCGSVIVVSSSDDASAADQAAASTGASDSYSVSVTDGDQRAMTMDEIVAAYNEGVIDAETFVWAEGMDDWQPLREVDPIVDALHDAAARADAEAAVQQSGQAEHDLGATVAMVDGVVGGVQEVAGDVPDASAAPAPTVEGAPAGLEPAEGAAAMAPVAPTEAGAPLVEGQAGGFLSDGLVPGAGGSPDLSPGGPAAGVGGGTGVPATPEDSAIFSLNMLTAKVPTSSPSASSGFAQDEDSGLIDLKALAAGMSTDADRGAADLGAAGGVFPLGAPPSAVPARGGSLVPEAPAKKTNVALIGLMGVAVVALLAVVVFLLVRGPTEETSTTATTATAPTTEVPTTETTSMPTTESTATATESATDTASASTGTSKVAAATTRYTRPTTKTKTKTKTATRPAGGPGSKCGCAPDDLMCHMRCSQK